LPAGATTQLSWHTNLRQAHDKLSLLVHHPLPEVQAVAKEMHKQLMAKYAHSFGHKTYPDQEAYRIYCMNKYSYFAPTDHPAFAARTTINKRELAEYLQVIKRRPIKTNLPLFLGELGQVTFDFLLDFGSFRDVQRHRNGVCRMPLLSTRFGFHEWYLNELPEASRKRALKLINEQKKAIKALRAKPDITQYYVAMGFLTPCRVTYALPAAVYTMELRSGKLVHPTLRSVALQMHKALAKMFPDLVLHPDLDKDDWSVRRGMQDIREKK
jgi:hypothetical protein